MAELGTRRTTERVRDSETLRLKLRAPYFYPKGSGRQGRNPAGESPVVSIARFRHVVIPQFVRVTARSLRGVNGPAALETQSFSGGSSLGA